MLSIPRPSLTYIVVIPLFSEFPSLSPPPPLRQSQFGGFALCPSLQLPSFPFSFFPFFALARDAPFFTPLLSSRPICPPFFRRPRCTVGKKNMAEATAMMKRRKKLRRRRMGLGIFSSSSSSSILFFFTVLLSGGGRWRRGGGQVELFLR